MNRLKYLIAFAAAAHCALAATAYADNLSLDDSKTLFENIGFVLPEKENDEDFITRGEFIYTLTQFAGTSFSTSSDVMFGDVENQAVAGALSYAVANGIVSNGEKFYPDNEVSYNEAFKMAVAFIGASVSAERMGGYPGGYEAAARAYGIADGLEDETGEKLTVGDFYRMLENIGRADTMKKEPDGSLLNGDTVFEEYFDMYEIRGVITANENTSLYESNYAENEGCIRINDDTYEYSGECTIGKRVEGWARKNDGGTDECVFIKEYKNSEISLKLKDIERAESNTLYYLDNSNKTKNIKTEFDAAFIYNGKAAEKFKLSDIESLENGLVTLIDNDDDGKYEVVNIKNYYVMVADGVNAYDKLIIDKNGVSPLDLSDDTIKYSIYFDTNKLEFDDLKKGDLLMIYSSYDGKLTEIVVLRETLVGKIEGYSDEYVFVNGIKYEYSEYFEQAYKSKVILGEEIELLLSSDGIVQAVANEQFNTIKYGFILRMWQKEGEADEIEMKMYTEDGELLKFELADKIRYNNVSKKEKEVYNILKNGLVLVRYKLDSNGELSMIDTQDAYGRLDEDANPYDCMTKFKFPENVARTIWYIKETDNFHPYFRLGATTKIFVVAQGDGVDDEKRCAIKTADYFRNNQSQVAADINAYDVTQGGVAGAVVINDNSAIDPTITNNAATGIVYKVLEAVTPEDEDGYMIVIYSGSKYTTYYTTKDLTKKFIDPDGNPAVEKGDAVSFETDMNGYISVIRCDYDYSQKKMNFTNDNSAGTHSGKGVFYYGMVYEYDGENMTIVPEGVSGITPSVDDETSRFSFMVEGSLYVVEENCTAINEASASEILSYRQAGSSCSNVLIRTNDGRMAYTVVYK